MLLAFSLAWAHPSGAPVAASTPQSLTAEQQAFADELKADLACVCGSCARLPLSQCTCSVADQMRAQLTTQVALGKNRDQVLLYFIDAYGSQEPLATPIGTFNQLAWVVPLLVGVVLLIGIVLLTRRMGRSRAQASPATTPASSEAEARLDEELRRLN